MRVVKTRFITGLFLLIMVAGFGFAAVAAGQADFDQPLEPPSPVSGRLQVLPKNELAFHWYLDPQVETVNLVLVLPPATLYAEPLRASLRFLLIASLQSDALIQTLRRER